MVGRRGNRNNAYGFEEAHKEETFDVRSLVSWRKWEQEWKNTFLSVE